MTYLSEGAFSIDIYLSHVKLCWSIGIVLPLRVFFFFLDTQLLKLLSLHVKAEGIFRIAAENSQEEYVREQLNGGVVPEGIDVHCLAGLIKVYHCYFIKVD